MSETSAKSSVKKGFTAPVLKESNSIPGNIDKKKEGTKKTKKETNKTPEYIDKENEVVKKSKKVTDTVLDINLEGKKPKKPKKNKENNPDFNTKEQSIKNNHHEKNQEIREKEYNEEEKTTKSNDNPKKPQVSMTDSQYEEIFSAVLTSHGGEASTSLQNTPMDEFSEPSERVKVQTPTTKKGGSCRPDSQPISEPRTPSRQAEGSKNNTPQDEPKTPTQQQKRSVSPWGTHFSHHSSQASVILKEFRESQNSLLNSSTLMSPETSDSDAEGGELSQRSVCQLSQVSGYGSQGTYFKLNATDQRARLEELQSLRNVGVWVFCCRMSCQKQRYLADVTDPQDVPDVWYCHMNPDSQYNSCLKPEEQLSPEEEEDMIYNEYTAGSVVWARVAGYPWWPAMVDDDPDLEQYYWLDDDFKTVTWYHVVFFDEGSVTRAWVTLKNIDSYVKNENKYKQRMSRGIDFGRRIMVAKEQATDALTLGSYQRLKIYSFLARYKGPITTSESQANKTIKSYKLKGKGGRKPSAKQNSAGKGVKQVTGDYLSPNNKKPSKEKGKSRKRKDNSPDLGKPPAKKCKVNEKEVVSKNSLSKQTKTFKNCELSTSNDKGKKKKLQTASGEDLSSSNHEKNSQENFTKENDPTDYIVSDTKKHKDNDTRSKEHSNKIDRECDNMDTSNCEAKDNIPQTNHNAESSGNGMEKENNSIALPRKVMKSDAFSYNKQTINPKESLKKDNELKLDFEIQDSDKQKTSKTCFEKDNQKNIDIPTHNTIPETEEDTIHINTAESNENEADQLVCSSQEIKNGNPLDESMINSETLLEDFSEKTKLSDVPKLNIRDPRSSLNKSRTLKEEEHKEDNLIFPSTSYGINVHIKDLTYPYVEENLSQKSKSSSKRLTAQENNVGSTRGNPNDYREHRLSQDTIADFFAESEDAIVPELSLSQSSLPFEE